MIAATGVVVSSGITLTIFFPRSIEGELTAKDDRRERQLRSRIGTAHTDTRLRSFVSTEDHQHPSFGTYRSSSRGDAAGGPIVLGSNRPYTAEPEGDDEDVKDDDFLSDNFSTHKSGTGGSAAFSALASPSTLTAPPMYHAATVSLAPNRYGVDPERGDVKPPAPASPVYTPNRRRTEAEGGGVELGAVTLLTEDALRAHEKHTSHAHHILHNYRSPIGEFKVAFVHRHAATELFLYRCRVCQSSSEVWTSSAELGRRVEQQ
jgi:hypothetical protein